MRGIFYNSAQSLCSIHECGKMCYDVLKRSTLYTLDYSEDRIIYINYDFIVYNQNMTVNNWISEELVKYFGKPIFCIVTEVGLLGNDLLAFTPLFFPHYIVLDPIIKETDKLHAFGRPLEEFDIEPFIPTVPIIGSFGFATHGKDWCGLIDQVEKEFDHAIIRMNIPKATYVPDNIHDTFIAQINQRIAKSKLEIMLTHKTLTKEELVKWCSQNTINCFFYYREQTMAHGLSSVIDQAIVAKRPILTTKDSTFRHTFPYIRQYPDITIKDAINESLNGVLKMGEIWTQSNFLNKFEILIKSLNIA